MRSDAEIVEEYVREFHAANEPGLNCTESSADALLEMVFEDPDRAWRLIGLICSGASTDLLAYIGVRELEDFVHEHGETYVSEIESRAASNASFRRALGEVWLERGLFHPDIEARLVRATDGNLTLLSRIPLDASND